MKDTKIYAYIGNKIPFDGCRQEVQKRITKNKENIDLMLQIKENEPHLSIVETHTKQLQQIIKQVILLQDVERKLCAQNYEKFDYSKKIFITTIRQQVNSFHRLVQDRKNDELVSHRSTDDSMRDNNQNKLENMMQQEQYEKPQDTKVSNKGQKEKDREVNDVEKLKSDIYESKIRQSQIRQGENQELDPIADLAQEQKAKVRRQEEVKQAEKYKTFIESQNRKSQKNTGKTIKKVACILSIILIILLIIAGLIVNRVLVLLCLGFRLILKRAFIYDHQISQNLIFFMGLILQ